MWYVSQSVGRAGKVGEVGRQGLDLIWYHTRNPRIQGGSCTGGVGVGNMGKGGRQRHGGSFGCFVMFLVSVGTGDQKNHYRRKQAGREFRGQHVLLLFQPQPCSVEFIWSALRVAYSSRSGLSWFIVY